MKYIYVVITSRGATLHYSSRRRAEFDARVLALKDGWHVSEATPITSWGSVLDYRGFDTGTRVSRRHVNDHDLSAYARPSGEGSE